MSAEIILQLHRYFCDFYRDKTAIFMILIMIGCDGTAICRVFAVILIIIVVIPRFLAFFVAPPRYFAFLPHHSSNSNVSLWHYLSVNAWILRGTLIVWLGHIHKGSPQNFAQFWPPPPVSAKFCLLQAKLTHASALTSWPPPLHLRTSFMDYPPRETLRPAERAHEENWKGLN